MTWIHRHQLRYYLHDSMWIGPLVGLVGALVAVRITNGFDILVGWKSSLNPDSARTVLIMLASSMFTFIVFVGSALLIALQLASAQLTPRIIALVFRDLSTKFAMTLFVFTSTYCVAVVVRIGDAAPPLTTKIAVYSCVICMAVFLYLIDHIGKLLRPHKALAMVAQLGREVIHEVYPRNLSEMRRHEADRPGERAAGAQSCSIPARGDGVILACDIEGLVDIAQRADCVLEMVPQVGDFVAKGSPIFHVYGSSAHLATEKLRHLIAIGQERSPEQDPTFAFRIMVDIALKALSPAINDPTTAVLAIDRIHHLLRQVGGRHLDDERLRDSTGQIRLVYRTPGWNDFVRLAVTEIRQYGHDSIQVMRRLHAMLQSLIEILPEVRAGSLRRELELLNRTAMRSFAEPEEREMAVVGDSQGMGGGMPGDGISASVEAQSTEKTAAPAPARPVVSSAK